MSGSYLFDANIVVAHFNKDPKVRKFLLENDGIYISSTALGELWFGALKSARVKANLELIEDFVKTVPVVSCDFNTAKIFGEIKVKLKARGKPIPDNDVWIAASAMQHDLVVVTRDSHFNEIAGLKLETL